MNGFQHYIDHVTTSALPRRTKRNTGGWWSLAIFSVSVALLASQL